MKKVLLSLAFYITTCTFTFAAWIIISPPKFEFSAEKWERIFKIVKIINQTNKDLLLKWSSEDFIAAWETWKPSFVKAKPWSETMSLSKWITINNWEKIIVKKWERLEIPFSIQIPNNAEPWGHYWSVFFAPPTSKQWQVSVVQKIWSLLLVKVNWEIRKEWKVLEIWIDWKEKTNIWEFRFLQEFPIPFFTRYENSWNIHLKPKWEIVIYDMFSKKMKNIWVIPIVNKYWLKTWEKIVDFIPINYFWWSILRDSVRKFEGKFEGKVEQKWGKILFSSKNEKYWEDYEKNYEIFKKKILNTGIYTSEVNIIWAKDKKTSKIIKFIIFPYKEIAWLIITIILSLFIIIKYRKFSRRRLEAKIKKQMEELNKENDKK